MHISISFPSINFCFLQCNTQPQSFTNVNSIALLKLQPSYFEAHPPPLNTTEEKFYRLSFDWCFTHSYFQLLQIVQKKNYDNVFNKVPVLVFPNWSQIVNHSPILAEELCTKLIFDLHIPEIKIRGTIGKVMNKITDKKVSASTLKIWSGNCLNINISTINIITVLGNFSK